MVEVKFYDPFFEPEEELTYSVIVAKYLDNWVFVRHQGRSTFEIAAGHIETDESPFEAASRELMEETGANSFRLECVGTYSVVSDNGTGYGRLYFAEISEIGPIPDKSEIAEIILSDHLPDALTYPDIQPHLFKKVLAYLDGINND
jgi:8-oxo-dGTP diphosphatase